MPCIYRIKLGERVLCGARVPLSCGRGTCPFGPQLWERLIRHDRQSRTIWLMPQMRMVGLEDLDPEGLAPGVYVVKSIVLSAGGRGRCRSGRRSTR